MSARTCQLCGRPLSRIWIGAGEFCSREHRNQYRMRRGMDRLLEANEVATLMRRRESPKPIVTLVPSPDSDPRVLTSSPSRFLDESALAIPFSRWSPAVHIPSARGPVERGPQDLPAAQRDYGILRGAPPRIVPGFHAPRIEPPGAGYLNRARRPKVLFPAAMLGIPLRVSASAGFRLPAVRTQSLGVPLPCPAAMPWPDRLMVEGLRRRELQHGSSRTLVIRFPQRASAFPEAPDRVAESRLKLPGVVRIGAPELRSGGPPTTRAWAAIWTYPEDVLAPAVRMRRPGWDAEEFVELAHRGICGLDNSRMALVRLTPQEGTYDYAPAVAGHEEPRLAVSRAGLQEHFDSGLCNWVGGVEDWTVDAAGIRTGALALFMPSLELRDYDLEFLARIEHQSVTWVFRASGENEYYAATLAVTLGGSLEFTRRAVIGGAAEGSVSSRQRPRLKSRTFAVHLRATGDNFAVWLDGQHIDTWSDSRLPSGGIGFVGTPQDRARIYWVRLSPAGEPSKEHSV